MSPRSLLFSSDQETLHVVGQVLKELGLEVESCLEIFSAIEKLTTKTFDVVVADLDDGAEAAFLLKTCQELNSTRSALAVAIAGVGMSSAQPGAGLILNKPLIPERMKWSLTHWEPFSTRLAGEPNSAKGPADVPAPVASKRGPVLVKNVKPAQMPPTLRPWLVGLKQVDSNRVDPKKPDAKPEDSTTADLRRADSRRVDLPRREARRVELPQHRVELPQEHLESLEPQQDTFDPELIPEDGLVPLAESASAKFRGHSHNTSFTATPRGLGFLDDENPLHVRDSYSGRKGSFSRIYRPMMMAAALFWLAYIGVQPARSAALVSSVAVIYTQAVEHTQSWLKAPKKEQVDDDDDDARGESQPVRRQSPRPERVEVIHLEPLVPIPPAAAALSPETAAQTAASNSGPGIPDSLKASLPQSPTGTVAAAVEAKLAPSSVLSGMQPVLVPEEFSKSMVLNRVEPDYPKQALSSGLQGAVVLQALIGRDGKVSELKLVHGYMILGKAASDAVRQWRFRPYILNGQAVDAQTYITVDFKLPNT
jgi:TonB family protein